MHDRNDKLLLKARQLRKNMTKEERHLWYDFLRECPRKFRRQEIIGNYIVDFYCSSKKIILELDGSQHYEPTKKEKDDERTRYFNSLGFRVLRFSNREVMQDFRGVCERILLEIGDNPSVSLTADSSPFRGAEPLSQPDG